VKGKNKNFSRTQFPTLLFLNSRRLSHRIHSQTTTIHQLYRSIQIDRSIDRSLASPCLHVRRPPIHRTPATGSKEHHHRCLLFPPSKSRPSVSLLNSHQTNISKMSRGDGAMKLLLWHKMDAEDHKCCLDPIFRESRGRGVLVYITITWKGGERH
jgi:hypothetical protein